MIITRRGLLGCCGIAALGATFGGMPLRADDKPAIPVRLYKSPGCDCCEGYAAYLRQHGFSVTVSETTDLAAVSGKAGIPGDLQGCHTAFIEGYVVDGHVPIEAVQKLLREHPAIAGLTLPGMPTGSPGMAGAKEASFVVYAIDRQGQKNIYLTL